MIDLNKLSEQTHACAVRRGKIKDDTKWHELTNDLCREAQELATAFYNWDEVNRNEELADIMIVCLSIAKHYGIDIEQAIIKKMAYNEVRED